MAKIFAFLSPRALGNFAIAAVMASSIRELFDEGELYVYYRDDRPYKKHIVNCIRNVDGIISSPPGPKGMLPIDLFDPFGGRVIWNNQQFENARLKAADLVLCGSMLLDKGLLAIPTVVLRPPPESIDESDQALLEIGVDPARWIACVYWKEPGYPFRIVDPGRDIYDPAPYIAAIRHIVEDLGGQVIRLGHPTGVEIPEMKGFFDLAKVAGSEWLQIYAVTVARFFLGSSSGPVSYGPAFGIPTVITDQNLCLGAWNPHDYIVTQHFRFDGKVLSQAAAYDAGCLFQGWAPGKEYELIRNTAAELIAAADEMFNSTRNCLGWRQVAAHEPKLPRPNSVSLPFPARHYRKLVIPPSLRK